MHKSLFHRVEGNMKKLFTDAQLQKIKTLGSGGLTIKLAQADGYTATNDSKEKNLMKN